MSFASFKGLMNQILPRENPAASVGAVDRVSAFERYIADLERRGGGEQVPDFAQGLEWLNAPPLSMSR